MALVVAWNPKEPNIYYVKYGVDNKNFIHTKMMNDNETIKCLYVTEGHSLNEPFVKNAKSSF